MWELLFLALSQASISVSGVFVQLIFLAVGLQILLLCEQSLMQQYK